MANPDHVDIIKQGIGVWDRWREENPDICPDLSSADLRGIDLITDDFRGADLNGASFWAGDLIGGNLTGVNLRGANLSNASLIGVDLIESNLSEAKLINANLSNANLREANLHSADLSQASLGAVHLGHANFYRTNLTEAGLWEAELPYTVFHSTILDRAQLERAELRGTQFANTDLSAVLGLEAVIHRGPSSIDVQTLLNSQALPLAFLRGVGLPDIFIDYLGSLREAAITGFKIDYYSCFISHAREDHDFALRLHDDLQESGVRCWLDVHDLKMGDVTMSTVDSAIRDHDKLIIILSKHSVRSVWVEREVLTAMARERRERKHIVFPVRIDNAIKRTHVFWARQLYELRHIGDLRLWADENSYRAGFERLLEDLRSGPALPEDGIPLERLGSSV